MQDLPCFALCTVFIVFARMLQGIASLVTDHVYTSLHVLVYSARVQHYKVNFIPISFALRTLLGKVMKLR